MKSKFKKPQNTHYKTFEPRSASPILTKFNHRKIPLKMKKPELKFNKCETQNIILKSFQALVKHQNSEIK